MSMIVNDYYDQWSWWRLAKHKHSLCNMVNWNGFMNECRDEVFETTDEHI